MGGACGSPCCGRQRWAPSARRTCPRLTQLAHWCEACGGYAYDRAVLLARECPGPPRPGEYGGRAQQLRRLQEDRDPRTGLPLTVVSSRGPDPDADRSGDEHDEPAGVPPRPVLTWDEQPVHTVHTLMEPHTLVPRAALIAQRIRAAGTSAVSTWARGSSSNGDDIEVGPADPNTTLLVPRAKAMLERLRRRDDDSAEGRNAGGRS